MNGEMYQICRIVVASKNALKTGKAISYEPIKYENKIEFQLLPQKNLLYKSALKADSVFNWYEHCLKKGLHDIKMLTPITIGNRNILGFSNTTQSSIVCFFRDGKVSYFFPKWEFDSVEKLWNILYTEHEWTKPPLDMPKFKDNTKELMDVLEDIKELACQIECDSFAKLFQKAANTLIETVDYINAERNNPLPQIPDKNLRIFEAASIADVFGAMGSWNDSPPYMAHEKGLDREYETLSSELLKQVRLAILYAVNEW